MRWFIILCVLLGACTQNNNNSAANMAMEDKKVTDNNTDNKMVPKEKKELKMSDKVVKTNEEWRKELTPEQYCVLREQGTERPFSNKYYKCKDKGMYKCAACGNELFSSDTKYDSGSGWPSFWQPVDETSVGEKRDTSHGMVRVEVVCNRCNSHLGHVFEDGPNPTGLRYCINSASLELEKEQNP